MAKAANASSSLALHTLSRALSRFSRWWLGELAALAPPRLRDWWQGEDSPLMLSFQGDRCIFERLGTTGRHQVLAVDARSEASPRSGDVGYQVARIAGRRERVLLSVPPDRILRRTVSLPLAVEENLRQSLAFELDRYTPFRPEQVYFDHRILDRDPDRRRLTVELAVVSRSNVDPEADRAAALGVPVAGAVMVDPAAGRAAATFRFMVAKPELTKPVRNWLRLGLALLAAALLAMLLAVPIWQKRTSAMTLLRPLDQARIAALETDALRDRLDRVVKDYSFLVDMKWSSPSTLLILEEISKRLPDDSYISQFEFDGKTVQLQGESPNPTGLVESLEASPLFKDVGFKAQLTKIQGTPNDRFHIAATLEVDAQPKPMPRADGSTAPPTAAVEPTPSPTAGPAPVAKP